MNYKCLDKQVYKFKNLNLIPIRFQDRFDIMKWRNEQISHLRQKQKLTKDEQNEYFENVIKKQFSQENPKQILFSLIENKNLIAYGGLVHIDWNNRNAEISFLIKTSKEGKDFVKLWVIFLKLIEQVAFETLNFKKIYTYSFEGLRPKLYDALEKSKYILDGDLNNHVKIGINYKNVLIHSKQSNNLLFRNAVISDDKITYKWHSNKLIRKFSFESKVVSFKIHLEWFKQKLKSFDNLFLIAEVASESIGVFRAEKKEKNILISFLLDPNCHGCGLGNQLFVKGVEQCKLKWNNVVLIGQVKHSNISSLKLFRNLNFDEYTTEKFIEFKLKI